MIAYIWVGLVVIGTVCGIALGNGEAVADAVMNSAGTSAALCLGMLGTYMLWMGIMNNAKDAGLIEKLSKAMQRPLGAIFRGVKKGSAAMGYIAMNIAANMLGMGNAATPFGLKAMQELQKENKVKHLPSDDMCTFLILNTASVQLLPLSVIAVRAAAGSSSPSDIVLAAFLATLITAIAGLIGARIFSKVKK